MKVTRHHRRQFDLAFPAFDPASGAGGSEELGRIADQISVDREQLFLLADYDGDGAVVVILSAVCQSMACFPPCR